MMQKQMVVALPLLLAAIPSAAQNGIQAQKFQRFDRVDEVAATIVAPASMGSEDALQITLAPPSRHGSSVKEENILCSSPCLAEDEPFVIGARLDRIELANRREALRGPAGAPTPSQVCAPSPLSAAEIEALVERIALAQGVDPQLASAIAWAESRFDRVRNSPKGARGPMQLMPATALELGVADVCDPRANIEGGVRHLRRLLVRFGHPLLAIAAYNAGSRAVIDNNGIPPFAETQAYVARVINRQLGSPRVRHDASVDPAAAGIVPRADLPGDRQGSASNRFVNGVMHLSSQGEFQ